MISHNLQQWPAMGMHIKAKIITSLQANGFPIGQVKCILQLQ